MLIDAITHPPAAAAILIQETECRMSFRCHRHRPPPCLWHDRTPDRAGADLRRMVDGGSPRNGRRIRQALPGCAPRGRAPRRFFDPSIDLIVIVRHPARPRRMAVEGDGGGQGRDGRQTRLHHDGPARRDRAAGRDGRIWSIDFSERFEVPSVTRAAELVADGAIGRVVQTIGPRTAPAEPRDAARLVLRSGGLWRDPDRYRQPSDRPVPAFHRVADAEVTLASVENYANPGDPGLQDFGEIALRSDEGRGYIRVDWFTPDALPNWGDGRLTILGTEGYIELRKYVDVGARGYRHADPRQRRPLRGDRCASGRPALFRPDHRGCAGPDGNRDDAGALSSR
jgi:hypothetical protein